MQTEISASIMPSYHLDQFGVLDEMMCKQFLSIDLRGHDSQPSSLSSAMKTPGYIGRERSCDTSLSLSTSPTDNVHVSPTIWGQRPESHQASLHVNSTQWRKQRFLPQRSVSMVETSSATAAGLGWPDSDMKDPQEGISPTMLNHSMTTSATSSASTRYKTELCRSFTENGMCKYGGKCQFAHGPEELRDLSRHPKYKTEPCRTFHTIGFCPYGIRCHFVHNNEEEKNHLPSSFSSSSFAPLRLPSTRSRRIPLIRQSVSFAGFPSAPQQTLPPHPPPAPFSRAPSVSPPCADITNLLSNVFLEMDSTTFEVSPAPQYQGPTAAEPFSSFLPSPDSGCSPSGLSPSSPSLRQSPGASAFFSRSLGTRSLSYTSLSDQDQDGSSSSGSLNGLESCSGINDGKRLAVFSQLSVPEDAGRLCL
ncbi:mRNA decay activator protein ZFP36L1 isoform X1 [Hippocampus zosterae]|uniref:mRNA decay activator protein ZFP36L1 isoform X1 n=1 Tax=Hippocampus zosterae TaxID=109293 RepID=UPI00223D453B|nr:mRNA decay activator protein ZFP36L1 isoform X1 [Hippocampus zosterae]